MFGFEIEPHDDGSFAREAVTGLLDRKIDIALGSGAKRGTTQEKVVIVATYDSFFLIERMLAGKYPSYEAIAYRDISNGSVISSQINNSIRRIEDKYGRPSVRPVTLLD